MKYPIVQMTILATFLISIAFAPQSTTAPSHHLPQKVGDTYQWTEGYTERVAQLVRFEEINHETVPIFYDPVSRLEMTLPGGVILITDPGVSHSQLNATLRQHELHIRFEPMANSARTYIADSPPGVPTLHTAQKLNELPGIDAAIPNWFGEHYVLNQDQQDQPEPETPTETPPEDRHSDTIAQATPVVIETKLYEGTLTPGDVDYFSITIPDGEESFYAVRVTTDIARYARYNYFRIELQDADQNCLARPCQEEGLVPTYTLLPGTYHLKISPSWRMTRGYLTYSFRVTKEHDDYLESLRCAAIETKYNDPLYGCQWHHNNTIHNGATKLAPTVGGDLNTEEAWDAGILGEGVHVRIADKGMDIHHPDIKDNVRVSLNNDYRSPTAGQYRSNGRNVFNRHSNHGDISAGLIAARDNDIGYRGVAPRATVSMHNSVTGRTLDEAISALKMDTPQIGVSSNSFSLPGAPRPTMASTEWELTIKRALTIGDHGRGTAIFYSGNTIKSYLPGSDTNTSALQTHQGIIPVCSISDDGKRTISSGKGYSTWTCAPGGSHAPTKLDRYIMFSGPSTSGATAVAAGAAALIRSANRDLTWRDVKIILAQTAQKAEPEHPEWLTAGPHYRDTSKRYHYNPWYGFGVADAGKAVKLAQEWTNLPTAINDTIPHDETFTIADLSPGESPTIKELSFQYDGQINFVEYVNILVDFDHQSTRDLRITLESPAGNTSEILAPYISQYDTSITGTHRFASARHLGEDPNGVWKVRFSDEVETKSGTIRSVHLVISGHQSQLPDNNPPTGEPSVVSQPMVGQTISADTSTISDDDGINNETLRYRWIVYDGKTPESASQSDAGEYQVLAQHLGKKLMVQVSFQDSLGNAETTSSVKTQPVKAHKPDPPTGVSAQNIDENSAQVSWDPLSESAGMPVLNYTIQWRTAQQEWGQPTQSTTTPNADTQSVTISGLTKNTEYHFRVRTTTLAGTGAPSTVVTATTRDITPPVMRTTPTAESDTIKIEYNEILSNSPPPNPGQFTVTTQDETITVSEAKVTGSTINLVLETYLTSLDSVTLQYQNDQTAPIKDAAGNLAAPFAEVAVSNNTPQPYISTAIQITRDQGYIPERSGYNYFAQSTNQPADHTFTIGSTKTRVFYVLQLPGMASIGLSNPLNKDFVLHIGERTFRGSEALYTPLVASYSWPIDEDLWPDQEQVNISITPISRSSRPMPELEPKPPHMFLYKHPLEHDGNNLNFRLIFSHPINVTAQDMANQVVQLDNADVVRAVDVDNDGSHWLIDATPHSTKDVHVAVPQFHDCDTRPNLCTSSAQPTRNGIQTTIPGPPMSVEFTDVPQTHDGESDFTLGAQLSEPLGDNGKNPTTQSFRVANATIKQIQENPQNEQRWDITVTPSGDNPIALVMMTVDDCDDPRATCTETGKPLARTGAAIIQPQPADDQQNDQPDEPDQPPHAPTNLTATENDDLSITLNWAAPDDDTITGYQILRRRPQEGEPDLLVLVEDTDSTQTTYTDHTSTEQTRYVYRVKAVNSAGAGKQSNYVRIDR